MTHMPDMPDDRTLSLLADDQYFRAVRWNERLSEEEVSKYLERVVRGSSERLKPAPNQWVLSLARDARDRLVEDSQPMVIYVAKRALYRFTHFQLMDLIQEGNIGLLRAIDTFATAEGYLFPAYANVCIWDAVQRVLQIGESSIAVHSAPDRSLLLKLHRFDSQFFAEHGCRPDVFEVAKALSIGEEKAVHLLRIRAMDRSSSLSQEMLYENGKEGKEHFVSLFAQSAAHESVRQQRLRLVFDAAMEETLKPLQQEAVRRRFDLVEEEPSCSTYEEVGEVLGTNRAVARSHVDKGVKRLRRVLTLGVEKHQPICEQAEKDYYTTFDAASLLQISISTVRRAVHSGELPSLVRVSAFSRKRILIPKQAVHALLSAEIPSIVA